MPNKFTTLLPPNARPAERALEQATIEAVLSIPDMIRIVKHPALCPVELLPWLAWEFSVDTWNTDWTESEKRAAITRAAYIHRHRGTRAAIEMSLSSSPFSSEVIEWFEKTPRGEPYTFSLYVTQDDRPITLADVQDLKSAVMKGKNLRSWFDVTFKGDLNGRAILAGYMTASESLSMLQAFELIGVHVNGWMTSSFTPITAFNGAVYTLMVQGNIGAITWQAEGPATVADDGTVTITGPGRITITGTDSKRRTLTHSVTPTLYFIPSAEQMLQADMPAFVALHEGRLPLQEELTPQSWVIDTELPSRGMGTLWGEWGKMAAYGWREWRNDQQREQEHWRTDTLGKTSIGQEDPTTRRFVRLGDGTATNLGLVNTNRFSVAAAIDLENT